MVKAHGSLNQYGLFLGMGKVVSLPTRCVYAKARNAHPTVCAVVWNRIDSVLHIRALVGNAITCAGMAKSFGAYTMRSDCTHIAPCGYKSQYACRLCNSKRWCKHWHWRKMQKQAFCHIKSIKDSFGQTVAIKIIEKALKRKEKV